MKILLLGPLALIAGSVTLVGLMYPVMCWLEDRENTC